MNSKRSVPRGGRKILALASLLFAFGLAFVPSLAAQTTERDSLDYVVVMKSGDSFRGNVVSTTDTSLIIRTEFDVVEIPKRLISEFLPLEGQKAVHLRPAHHFLMPTASPNGPGVFLSNYELGFLYGGVGLGYGATITAGMTVVPMFSLSSQLFHAGAKFTVERSETMELALGATYSFITTREPYAHLYGVATLPLGTGRWSSMIFYRVSGDETAPIELYGPQDDDTTTFTLYYQGSLGLAVGFDAPAFGRDDMKFVGEIWNNDVTRPQNTVSMLGVRIFNEHLSADFGLAFLTTPFVAPVVSFSWKP